MDKKFDTTYEVCPHCGEEVELKAELMAQTCPNCGKRIVTCSMCRACDSIYGNNYCNNCCLEFQAEVENKEKEEEIKAVCYGRDDLLSVAEQIVYDYGKGDGEELVEILAKACDDYLNLAR